MLHNSHFPFVQLEGHSLNVLFYHPCVWLMDGFVGKGLVKACKWRRIQYHPHARRVKEQLWFAWWLFIVSSIARYCNAGTATTNDGTTSIYATCGRRVLVSESADRPPVIWKARSRIDCHKLTCLSLLCSMERSARAMAPWKAKGESNGAFSDA